MAKKKPAAKTARKAPRKSAPNRKATAKPKAEVAQVSVSPSEPVEKEITPLAKWTHDGDKVLLVKCVDKGGISHGGFQWPKSGTVTTPNWKADNSCESGGLFGWPWGLNLGGGKEPMYDGDWIVFAASPESVVDMGDKAKAGPSAEVLYYGPWAGALEMTRAGRLAWLDYRIKTATENAIARRGEVTSRSDEVCGAATASGDSGAATASGYRGAATASGDRGAATASGYSGAATASGYRGAATASGDRGAATASGYSGAATASGYSGAAGITGEYSTIDIGPNAAGVSTAEDFYWTVRTGAVLLCRWKDGHCVLVGTRELDGQTVRVVRGQVA